MDGYLLVCMVTVEKKLKPADLSREVLKRIEAIKQRWKKDVSNQERAQIKDDVILEFLPKTLPSESRTYGYFDWKNNGHSYNIWGATAGVINRIIEIVKSS